MKIIIAGAGAIGFHLAELLSKEDQDITLIDMDAEILDQVGRNLDVMTKLGDAASLDILEEVEVDRAKLFIAVTTSEKTNLLSAILAKKLGAKKTIARINNMNHFSKSNKKRLESLGVDQLISPQKLAASEIIRLLDKASFTDMFDFEDGKISVVGFTLDTTCPYINHSLRDINRMEKDFEFRGLALLRGQKTIIPDGDTLLLKGDHLYISTQPQSLQKAMKFVGKQIKPIKNVMIVGGTSLALRTAQVLESKYNISVVVKDENRAKEFVALLDRALIINDDPSDIEALKLEGLEGMDAFIALTENSETNIITSLMAEELSVYKTIALVENVNYTHISQNIGIDTIINKKLITANNIFRYVRKGKVEAIASLHGVDAEIIEFEVHKKNRLLQHPIRDLHFPKDSVIAGVVRGERSFVPDGNSTFELNDKVVVLALPNAIKQVEEIFK